jgi:hypothetical protein
LKIPETIDTRWLSNHRSIHAVKECYRSIILACDGANLASLAGGILLDITQSSFLITLVVLYEALSTVNNLSKVLQKENLQLSSVPVLISSSINYLKNVSDQCLSNDENNSIHKYISTLKKYVCSSRKIVENKNKIKSLKEAKKIVDTMIE